MKQYKPTTLEECEIDGTSWYDKYLEEYKEYLEDYNIKDNRSIPEAKADDFLWLTHKGDFIYVSAMETNHLFNALRMLFNHGVPPAFRVGEFVRHNEVFEWTDEYKEQAFDGLKAELTKRENELSQDQQDALQDMIENGEAYDLLRMLENTCEV